MTLCEVETKYYPEKDGSILDLPIIVLFALSITLASTAGALWYFVDWSSKSDLVGIAMLALAPVLYGALVSLIAAVYKLQLVYWRRVIDRLNQLDLRPTQS